MTRLSWYILLAVLVTVPLPLGGNRPLAWSVFGVVISAGLLAWVHSAVAGGRGWIWSPALRDPAILFAIVIAWILIQSTPLGISALEHPVWQMTREATGLGVTGFISLAPNDGLAGLTRLLSACGVFWLAYQHCRSVQNYRTMLKVLIAASLAYALYGILVYLTGNARILWFEKWAYLNDLTSTFVNRNNYATFAGLGLLIALALATESYRWRWAHGDRSEARPVRAANSFFGPPLAACVGGAVILVAVLQTHSRMGFVSSMIGLAAFGAIIWLSARARPSPFIALPALGVVASLIYAAGEETLDRLAGTEGIDRLPLFAVVSEMIAVRPWTGTGYGSFAEALLLFRDERLPASKDFTEAHSSYLELAAELGLPAATALLAALTLIWWAIARGAYRTRSARVPAALAASCGVLVASHALVDFSMQVPAVSYWFAALLGLGAAQALPNQQYDPNGSPSPSVRHRGRRGRPQFVASRVPGQPS